MQKMTLKNGTEKLGYWNGKEYNGVIYFNISADGTKKGINWKKAEKINRAEVKSILAIKETTVKKGMPKTVEGWMREMERSERA